MKKLAKLQHDIARLLPNATWGEDNDGQLVIYTNETIVAHWDGDDFTMDMDELGNQ